MHYTGTIWRPPYEAASLLLEVTAGCTHHSCRFCTLYNELPFHFRMSPLADVEADLKEIARLYRPDTNSPFKRTFLTGANPFVLKTDRLLEIARLIQTYVPSSRSIGCFARITDITLKSEEELEALHRAGYDGLTIGMETGDDQALTFMNKGYTSADIVTQCCRLERAGIHYRFFYLTGISGAGRGEAGALSTARVCNQLKPDLIGANMLTVFPESALYQDIQGGSWTEESETEKYQELRTLITHLKIPTIFAAMGASNAFQLQGTLPGDRKKLLVALDRILHEVGEEELQRYRRRLPHL